MTQSKKKILMIIVIGGIIEKSCLNFGIIIVRSYLKEKNIVQRVDVF